MDFSLYQNLISDAIDSTKNKNGTVVTNQLKAITNSLSERIPFILDKNTLVSSNFDTKFTFDKIALPSDTGTIKQILGLSDGSFLVIHSDAALLQYTNSFSLSKTLPFAYTTVTTNQYTTPGDCAVISFTNEDNIIGDYLFIPITGSSHVVQVYQYILGVWSYIGLIGTLDSANYSTDHLSTPVAVSGFFNTELSEFELLVSCTGTSGSGTGGFIKKFSMPLNGPAVDGGVILSKVTTGDMVKSEITNIIRLVYNSTNQIYALSVTSTELGMFLYDTEVNATPIAEKILKGVIKTLDYADSVYSPVTFAALGSYIVTGDNAGHIAIVDPNFTDIPVVVGKASNTDNATTYPLEFSVITDLFIQDDSLYIIADSNLYISNILTLASHQAIYKITNGTHPINIDTIYGLPAGTVEISLDNINYYPVSELATTSIPYLQDIYIRVTRSLKDVIANYQPLKDGILLASL